MKQLELFFKYLTFNFFNLMYRVRKQSLGSRRVEEVFCDLLSMPRTSFGILSIPFNIKQNGNGIQILNKCDKMQLFSCVILKQSKTINY